MRDRRTTLPPTGHARRPPSSVDGTVVGVGEQDDLQAVKANAESGQGHLHASDARDPKRLKQTPADEDDRDRQDTE